MTTDSPTGTDLVYAGASLRERQDYAIALSKAGALVPKGFREANGDASPGKILLAAEYGNMVGVHPVAALNGINVIDGKPTPSPALMSALVRKAGHKLRVTVQGTGQDLSATATLVRRDDPDFPFTVTWTLAKAKRAGLDQKDVWKKYPEAMLKARAISEVCREGAEDVLLGMTYTAEELGAEVNEAGEVIDITSTAVDRTRYEQDHDGPAVTAAMRRNRESEPDPDIIKARGLANETEVMTRPDRESSATADTRPRSSRTKAEPGAGRTDALEDQHAIADVAAEQGRNALNLPDWRDVWASCAQKKILDYPLSTGELLRDVLRARGEHLADEEAQAAAGEPADDGDVPLELPF